MTSSRTVSIVAAHSDDQILGMGGTNFNYFSIGDKVFIMSLTDGVGSRDFQEKCAPVERPTAASMASKELVFEWLPGAGFPDNAMETVGLLEIAKKIESVKNAVNPNLVYTNSHADINVDCQITCKAVLTASRPQPGEICAEIRTFEVTSLTDLGHKSLTGLFASNLFVDITNMWHKKNKALLCYAQEMIKYLHSSSLKGLENLARSRGKQCGVELAESFEIIRKIEK